MATMMGGKHLLKKSDERQPPTAGWRKMRAGRNTFFNFWFFVVAFVLADETQSAKSITCTLTK